MRYNSGYNREGDYEHLVVNESKPLLEWLLENVQQSRNKIKATLQGRGIKVNGKTVSQFDFQLEPGMKVAVSKTKRNQQSFKSRYVKIVYEDKWLIVIEKAEGILSMASLVRSVLLMWSIAWIAIPVDLWYMRRIWKLNRYLSITGMI